MYDIVKDWGTKKLKTAMRGAYFFSRLRRGGKTGNRGSGHWVKKGNAQFSMFNAQSGSGGKPVKGREGLWVVNFMRKWSGEIE